MSATTQTEMPGLAEFLQALKAPFVVLLVALAVLGITFSGEAMAAYRVWMDSTAYSHCLFVLPISLYLAWERRAEILAEPVVPLTWIAVLALPAGVAWLVAERLGIMEGRQLVALSIVELLFLAVLGWRMAIAMSAPLLYLYFLVPFGAFITPILQDWTAVFTGIGLVVLEIPHYMDGYLIEIPEGRFYIAEACAGLRFLIASIAFGVLYACLMYRTTGRRVGFVFASIAVPIVANWFRALGIVVLGHILGSAQAAAADHVIYGWVFFSAITLLLIVAGLPFRQDLGAPPARTAAPVPPATRYVPAAALVVVLAVAAPAVVAGFNRAAQVALPAPAFHWVTPLGCLPGRAVAGTEPGSERVEFHCPQGVLVATAQVFSPRVTWTAIGNARIALTAEREAEDTTGGKIELPGTPMPVWPYVVATGGPHGSAMTATALWTGGAPARGGLAGRVLLAKQSVFGGSSGSVLLSVGMRTPRESVHPEEERQMRVFLATFLQVQSNLGAEVERLGRVAAGL